jgi:hypothetical protein
VAVKTAAIATAPDADPASPHAVAQPKPYFAHRVKV